MTTNREELKRLALAATPGPWIPAGPSYGDAFPRYFNCVVVESETDDSPDICGDVEHNDADYIAAVNPTVLLSLLADLERAEAELKTMREQEHVAEVYTMQACERGAPIRHHVSLLKEVPRGTKLYAAPVAQPEQVETEEFREGQWWLVELDAMVTSGTPDQKRAVHGVVRNLMRQFNATQSAQPIAQQGWLPIESAPKDGYFLVHEDEAIRALFRYKGEWEKIGYPAIIYPPYGDVLVGEDAKRILPSGCTLEIRDGCCENPTHWMLLPPAPEARNG